MTIMEVDSKDQEEPSVAVHPLAIVNMSDQFTRITCGGSPLSPHAPVVGLLFGQGGGVKPLELHILDSDDIPVTAVQEDQQKQVALHQAVFPLHRVVGWYRVVAAANNNSNHPSDETSDQPTLHDLQVMRELQQRYQQQQSEDDTKNDTPAAAPFLFALLQAPSKKKQSGNQKDDQQEQLPLTLYQLSATRQALVALEHWNLETSDSERIGLEHVVRYQPPRQSRANNTDDGSSAFTDRLAEMDQSLLKIQTKLQVLEQFLVQTQNQSIPTHPPLLRQVQSLMWQLGPLQAGLSGSSTGSAATTNGMTMIQQLALLTRTVDAVQSYTDKVSFLQQQQERRPRDRGRAPLSSSGTSLLET